MVNDIITPQRGARNSRTASYRPDARAMYAPRVSRTSVQPRAVRPAMGAKPMMQDIVAGAPKQQALAPVEVVEPIVETEVDEVFARIAEVEREMPIAPIDVMVRAGVNESTVAAPIPFSHFAPAAPVVEDVTTEEIINAPKARRKGTLRLVITGIFAALILALTGYVSFDTWMTNNQVRQVTGQTSGASNGGGVVLGEGQDETEVTESAVDKYQVAADLPRVLSIDKIGVRARVLPMSVNSDGSLQAPVNIYDTGWYGASAKPGQVGAALIDAHASGATRAGVFAYIDTLKIGDQMSVEMGDGTKYTYKVTHKETVALDDVDMAKLLLPHGTATEGLNLITCTGEWVEEKKTYDHRVLVYTERVL